MGTSSSYGGPGGNTNLVPTWLGPEIPTQAPPAGPTDGEDSDSEPLPEPPNRPAIPPAADPSRFSAARNSFSRFVRSAGLDRANLGRAVSQYVSNSSGGPQQAMQRMGSSRVASGRLLGFLADVTTRGAEQALRSLDLENFVGLPIEQVFLGLADYICPDGGSVDEGIAREAFIETIIDLAENNITDLDSLTIEQMQAVFELYATNAIEARLCNDIGARLVVLPSNAQEAAQVQIQLRDFIHRGVSDALTIARASAAPLTEDNVLSFVDEVYKQSFEILRTMGETEAHRE